MVESTMTSKVERVKSLFDLPEKYLCPRQFDIQIRVETVEQFTENMAGRPRVRHWMRRWLDFLCPCCSRCKHLTLLDLSSKMLDLAREKIPSDRAKMWS